MTVSDIDDPEAASPEPANLKFLRRLITLVVIRVQQPAPGLAIPEQMRLPNGTVATAFTATRDWYAVVTDDNLVPQTSALTN